jgi:hypothetical protein
MPQIALLLLQKMPFLVFAGDAQLNSRVITTTTE